MTPIKTRLDRLEAAEREAGHQKYFAAIRTLVDYIATLSLPCQFAFWRWSYSRLEAAKVSDEEAHLLCGDRLELTAEDQPWLDEIDRNLPRDLFERIEAASQRIDHKLYDQWKAQQA